MSLQKQTTKPEQKQKIKKKLNELKCLECEKKISETIYTNNDGLCNFCLDSKHEDEEY